MILSDITIFLVVVILRDDFFCGKVFVWRWKNGAIRRFGDASWFRNR